MKKRSLAAYALVLLSLLCFFGVQVGATENTLELSQEEYAYFQEKKTIKVSFISQWRPFSYESTDGSRQGLSIEILEQLAEVSGVSLEWVSAKSYEESLAQLSAGSVDVMALYEQVHTQGDPPDERTALLMLPFLTTQTVIVQHKNTSLDSLPLITCADIKGGLPFAHRPNLSVIYYENPIDCINAVRVGQADISLCDSFTASATLQKYGYKDLLSIPSSVMQEFGFGVRPDADASLISALQKARRSFSGEDITRTLLLGSEYATDNFFEFIYRYPFEIICFAAAILFVIALSLITYTKVNIRQHQALQGYEESYRMLSDTFGEAGLEYDYLSDCLTVFGHRSNLEIEPSVEAFQEHLKNKTVRIALTPEQLEKIINEGTENKSFSTEFQCGAKSGEWIWYRLIYTVICTAESHRRPIRLVGCLANIDEEHAEKERLLCLSSNDQLTGLLNHKTAEERICSLLEQQQEAHMGMLVVVDIDSFKQFNDLRGHLCGDDVLRSVGQALREIFAPDDILCRWGGDEFLLFLVHENGCAKSFQSHIALLRQKMSAYRYADVAYAVTLSIGGAKNYPGSNFQILFQQADDALYLAKKNGKDQFWLYAPREQKSNTLSS